MKTRIRIDRETGLAYFAKALRDDGLVGEVVGLANARTLTLIIPGTQLTDVKRSLEMTISDLDIRIDYENQRDGETNRG